MRTTLRDTYVRSYSNVVSECRSRFDARLVLTVIFFVFSIWSTVEAQTTNLSFTRIPFSSPDIISPGRGAEIWHNEYGPNIVNTISETQHVSPKDIYARSQFTWDNLEPSRDAYDFSALDEMFRSAIPAKRKVAFCIITQWPDRDLAGVSYDGYPSSYPRYLHDLMQAETANSRDYVRANTWIPNYNSPNYLNRFEALLRAIANWVNTSSYQGVQYRDILGYVDIGGYGSWGEWNMVFVHDNYSDYPTGRMPLAASLIRIFDAHVNAFPNHQVIFNVSALDGRQLPNVWVPAEVGYHALNARNNVGKLGITKKSWGWPSSWFTSVWLDENPTVYNGMRFDTAAANRWRHAPINGEGPGGGTAIDNDGNGGQVFMNLLPAQVRRYHITQLGNGNFNGEQQGSVAGRDSLRAAWKLMGYRIVLNGGTISSTIAAGMPMQVSLQWQNIGVAPVYENWNVTYELQNRTTNAVVWTGNSNHRLRLWLPQANATTVADNFTLPSNIAAGTYRLVLKIVDPNNYREPFPLAIQGRLTDGSYLIRDNITLSATGGNQTPTANAGADQSITLPTSTATLTGTGNDPDGSIASYAWTKVSGPAGGTLSTPGTASSPLTGLVAGTYVYRLTVTDNLGATDTDDVTVVVNAAAPAPNVAPTANAGSNRTITLPTSSVTLNGSGTDTDGTIATYAWTKISGPAGGNIQSPNAGSTSVTGLNEGVYVFRLTVTDNDGATDTDDVQVTVNPSTAPSPTNQAPVANAGADQSITLPTNSVTFTGTATDADGSIATYAWTKVSGPAGGNIQSANAATTRITAMVAGTYVFRLTVTDNNGATDTDDVRVVVNNAQAAANQLPIANAGNNITITLPTSSTILAGSGTDPDGSIAGYSWAKVSGPAGGNIQASTMASTAVSTMATAGTYVFRLTVTDNLGAVSTDDVQVIVNAAPVVPNQAPIANAGADISITLPVNTATLNGASSRDADGSIATYAWTKVSGPAGGTLADPRLSQPTIAGLMQGTYTYELTVTDNDGARASDRVVVTVIRINKRPVVVVTDTLLVTLPVQNTELVAVDSYDPDGQVRSFNWTYQSGPQSHRILNPAASRTVVTDLVEGTYRFNVEATDNDGAKSSKAVVVIVSPNSGRKIVPDVNVYPNPASSGVNFNVSAPVNGRTILTFYDVNGRPVMTDAFTKSSRTQVRQVNISRLPKGTYFVLIQVDQAEKVTEKLIKY